MLEYMDKEMKIIKLAYEVTNNATQVINIRMTVCLSLSLHALTGKEDETKKIRRSFKWKLATFKLH